MASMGLGLGKRVPLGLALAVVIVVSALVLWGVKDESRSTGAALGGMTLVWQHDPARQYDTDPWFRRSWVRGCVASGKSATSCRCAINEYTTRLAPWEFETASAVARGGGGLAELPEHLREVVEDVESKCA
jgi:hypothetical protein